MLKKIIKKRAYEGNKIEDNLLFVTLQTQIVGLDMNNGYEQIFLSDKLSNMCNFYYDKDTKQLLVYNTSGHAYLYQMPEGKRLSQKLYLRAMDLQPDSIAHKGDYYWYSDTNFCLRRLDIKDGSTKQILKDKERRVVNVIQVADRLYIFTDMRREIEGYVKILCYHIDENGDLKYEFEWGERPYVFMGYVRRDFDRKTVIVGAKTYTKYVGDYYVAFEPENKRFVPIYPITDEAWELYGHTMLEGNKILAANPKYVKVIDIPSRKVLAKYEPEETIYSATFLTKNKFAFDKDDTVKTFTASVLSRFVNTAKQKEAIEILLQLCHEENELVRTEAYDAIGCYCEKSVVKSLEKAVLSEKDGLARSYAIDSWIYVQQHLCTNETEVIGYLNAILEKERDDNCILNCLYGKYSFGERAVLDEILNYIKNTDYHIRCSVLSIIELILEEESCTKECKRKIKITLTELLKREKANAVKEQAEEIMRWL